MDNLKIRPYFPKDFTKIRQWINDEESHMKWSANRISFTFTQKEFEDDMQERFKETGELAFVAIEQNAEPVGFFKMTADKAQQEAFLKYIIVDDAKRGCGLGQRMMETILQLLFQDKEINTVRLIVFDDNPAAAGCYKKVGFKEETAMEPLEWNGKNWARTRFVIKKEYFYEK